MKILACEDATSSRAATFDTGSVSLGGRSDVVAAKYLTRRCVCVPKRRSKARKQMEQRDSDLSQSTEWASVLRQRLQERLQGKSNEVFAIWERQLLGFSSRARNLESQVRRNGCRPTHFRPFEVATEYSELLSSLRQSCGCQRWSVSSANGMKPRAG